jgi:hypothetical protein
MCTIGLSDQKVVVSSATGPHQLYGPEFPPPTDVRVGRPRLIALPYVTIRTVCAANTIAACPEGIQQHALQRRGACLLPRVGFASTAPAYMANGDRAALDLAHLLGRLGRPALLAIARVNQFDPNAQPIELK